MADIPEVIATYGALVGVALGAGLTYGLGALNRRHQEAREDRTRWYEARFRAYTELSNTAGLIHRRGLRSEEQFEAFFRAASSVELVGSEQAVNACVLMLAALMPFYEGGGGWDEPKLSAAMRRFTDAARTDLGHPELSSDVRGV